MIPSRFGIDCCPAAKPGACPEDAPSSKEPQPDALVDAWDAQVAETATPPPGACDPVCDGAVGSVAGADPAGMDGDEGADWGSPVDGAAVGWAVGDWADDDGWGVGEWWCFVAVGLAFDVLATPLEATDVDTGATAVVCVAGELSAVVAALQPATIATMSEAPATVQVNRRPLHSERMCVPICRCPS